MEQNFDQDRRQAHALLDALSSEKLNVVRSLLELMVADFKQARTLLAPIDGAAGAGSKEQADVGARRESAIAAFNPNSPSRSLVS